MSFGGSVSAMISSLKNNKLPKRKFRNGADEFSHLSSKKLEYRNSLSSEEFQIFQQQLKKEKHRKDVAVVVSGIAVILLSTLLVIYFYH